VQLARLLGSGLSGFLIVLGRRGLALVVDAFIFLVVVVCTLPWLRQFRRPLGHERFHPLCELCAGFAAVIGERRLITWIPVAASVNTVNYVSISLIMLFLWAMVKTG
jgi:hypothetical protein